MVVEKKHFVLSSCIISRKKTVNNTTLIKFPRIFNKPTSLRNLNRKTGHIGY